MDLSRLTPQQREAYLQRARSGQLEQERKARQPTGLRKMLLSALPIAGGAVGSVAGLAGGPAGVLAGGAAGSGLGETLRQKLMGEELDFGTIGRETALGAVPGVLKGARAIRGAKAAGVAQKADIKANPPAVPSLTSPDPMPNQGLANALGAIPAARRPVVTPPTPPAKPTSPPVAPATTETAMAQRMKPSVADRIRMKGQQMEAKAGGFGINAKVPGEKPLGVNESKRIGEWLKAKGVSAGDPAIRLQAVQQIKEQAGQNIDGVISKANIPLPQAEVQSVADDFLKSVQGLSGKDETLMKRATTFADNLVSQAKDNKSLINFKRENNSKRSFLTSDDAATADEQQLRKILDEKLINYSNQKIPGIEQFNDDYSRASDVEAYLVKGAGNPKGVNLLGNNLLGNTVQSIKSKAGDLMQKAVGAEGAPGAAPASGGFRPFIKPAMQQTGTRAAASTLFGTPFVGQPQPVETAPAMEPGIEMTTESAPEIATGPSQAEQLMQNAITYAQETGDVKGMQAIMATAESMGKAEGGGKPLSAEASKIKSNAMAGLESIQELENIMQNDPGAFQRSGLPGVNTLDRLTQGRTSGALGTDQIEPVRQQIIDVIARLRTGAAITNDEAKRFEVFIPRPGDSPEAVALKTRILKNQFNRVATGDFTSGTDLQAAAGL